jgi:signal transduction histidine kinase/ActR/RegA family two-component response regulator
MPLKRRLQVLVVVALLPLSMVSAWGIVVLRDQKRAEVERSTTETMHAVSAAVDVELWKLIAAAETLAASDLLDLERLEQFHSAARSVVKSRASWVKVAVLDLDGRKVVDTERRYGEVLSEESDPESFQRVLNLRRPATGALAPSTVPGEFVLNVRVPVIRHGKVSHVLTLSARPSILLDAVQRRDLPTGSSVLISDASGRRVLAIGGPPSVSSSLDAMVAGQLTVGAGHGFGPTIEVGSEAAYAAFDSSPDTGFRVGLALPARELDALVGRSSAALAAGVFVSLLLGGLLATIIARGISRPIMSLRAAAVAIGRGQAAKPVHTDLPEVREVAEMLVSAAQSRQELSRRERAARASAERDSRAKDEFLAMLGHELRNPLAAIVNAVHVLSPSTGQPVAERAREIILRQSVQLARLLDDLLEVGRVVSGKIVLCRAPIDLLEVTRSAVQTLEAAGRCADHEVAVEGCSVWVDADATRLEQIVSNVLVNSVKYTPKGGHVQLSVAATDGQATLRVQDDGDGIDAELLPRVFDLFAQGERALSRSQGGLGIGLTLVKRLAVLHGGNIVAESEGEGRGSTFTLSLPACSPPAEAPAQRAAPATKRPLCVLVVEDNIDARDMLGELLRRLGHTVVLAGSGPEGVERAMDSAPDLALVDLGLPGFDGLEVARRICAQCPKPPKLVALTGYSALNDESRATEAGFDLHLVKPVSLEALSELLLTPPAESALVRACAPAALAD